MNEELIKKYLEAAYDEKYADHDQEDSHYKTVKDATINLILSEEKRKRSVILKALDMAISDYTNVR